MAVVDRNADSTSDNVIIVFVIVCYSIVVTFFFGFHIIDFFVTGLKLSNTGL